MVLNNIEKLLEKYDNGETTLQEEQQLKHYFTNETVPPHLESYKAMFTYFLVNEKEQFTKDVPLQSKRSVSFYTKWISVAAVAVLLIGFYFKSNVFQQQDDLGTYDDPKVAYNQLVQSLELISSNFNKGTEKLEYLNTYNKGVSKVGYLNEMDKTTSLIFKK
ncbi:hypothetical protein [Mangrovimonas spongiae]|uniref:Uncharacterized protein n=1 Tax=Mangrovimonas spongiae TaxID=2494697 RepID=A0A3R9NMH4_9FLAO|nr:hypothetical protein [Mangrovimonas spongiae]RSK39345.1 hypothetical protein EJA19_10505 [Mangrovimonas spongiae]